MKASHYNTVPYILSVDGKKVDPGLSDNGGDEDIFGFEQTTLEESRKEHLIDLQLVQDMLLVIDSD